MSPKKNNWVLFYLLYYFLNNILSNKPSWVFNCHFILQYLTIKGSCVHYFCKIKPLVRPVAPNRPPTQVLGPNVWVTCHPSVLFPAAYTHRRCVYAAGNSTEGPPHTRYVALATCSYWALRWGPTFVKGPFTPFGPTVGPLHPPLGPLGPHRTQGGGFSRPLAPQGSELRSQ